VLAYAIAACAPTPPPVTVPPAPPIPPVTWEQKIAWIVRLEDQRLVRDPAPPVPPVIRPAAAGQPAVVGPPPPSDLIALLSDAFPQVRARAALALGRVGLAEGVAPLGRLLTDGDVDVRQTAAFALGLIGDPAGRPPLLEALAGTDAPTQGRAAEALGAIGNRADAPAIATMVRGHIGAGALAGLQPDEIGHPLAPAVEAVRLGLYALVRLTAFDAIAATVLDGGGQPVSRWWPVAYALQRVPDPRGVPALVTLLSTPGRYTAAFAAKGLATRPPPEAVAALRQALEQGRAAPMVLVQAVRSLAAAGVSDSAPALLTLLRDRAAHPVVRAEATAAFVALAGPSHSDLLLDLLTDASPDARAAGMRGLARVDPDAFVSALASLDSDGDWRVRAAQAQALGSLPDRRGLARLQTMLADEDMRVIPAVMGAFVAAGAPDAARIATERLTSGDFVVRAAAATALADLKAVSAVPALVQSYRSHRDEPTYVARAAALAALDRLDRQAARPVLTEALADRDWAVRVRAAELLRAAGVAAATAQPLRPATAPRAVDDPAWQRIVAPPYAPLAYIDTSKGVIEIALAITDAPITVHNFVTLARKGFFDGVRVHRVVPDFVVQDGDPRGDGEGGPGYTIRDEINMRPYLRGTVGMALDWEDTGGSQFFIAHSPQPHLDGRYTVFGQVVNGMDVVDALTQEDVIQRVRVRDGVDD
jgi:cyclophilin family peptidyl-prolyl cis-trans isomerase/HEAT repeat protein